MKTTVNPTASNPNDFYDSVVVGGGMVGAATALGLAKLGLRVMLFEQKAPSLEWHDSMPFSVRVSALTRSSENILKNLGAWQGVENRRCQPFVAMNVWEQGSDTKLAFQAQEISEPNLGHTVENFIVQAALWEQIEKQPNIEVNLSEKIDALNLPALQDVRSDAVLTLDSGRTLSAQLVVGADGAFSKMRQLANIGLEQLDYEQCAVVGCVKTEKSHQNACWQRYNPEGPFAYLGMAEGMSSIAWYLPLDKMQWALDLDDEDFAREIEKASGFELGKVTKVAERSAFPLVRRHAKEYVKPCFGLVGDAAHTINPQAGQGVNIGLLDAAALIDQVSASLKRGRKIGTLPMLRKYERQRRGDNVIVQRSMEFFDRLFAAEMLESFRHLMTDFTGRSTLSAPFKHWLMEQVLKGRNELPSLAKPKRF